MKCLIVCGDRHYHNYHLIEEALRNERDEIALVIEGEADGADRMGRMAATLLHIPIARFPAQWNEYGRAAGPIRNEEMLQKLLTYDADREVWAFHKNIEASKGTLDMVTRAANVGVTVRLYDGDTLQWKKYA